MLRCRSLIFSLLSAVVLVSCSSGSSRRNPSPPADPSNPNTVNPGYNNPGNLPEGEPRAASGELTSESAEDFMVNGAAENDEMNQKMLTASMASSLTASLSREPAEGRPGENMIQSSMSCSNSLSGNLSDRDMDGRQANANVSYNCSKVNEEKGWSWTATGSSSVSDQNDNDSNSGVRYAVANYSYSGTYRNEGRTETYSGGANGFVDVKRSGRTSSSSLNFMKSFSRTDRPRMDVTYVSSSTFEESTDSGLIGQVLVTRGTYNSSGFIKYQRGDRGFILTQKYTNMEVDSARCPGSFKSGTVTYTDEDNRTLTVTYVNCKRQASFEGTQLAVSTERRDDHRFFSCSTFDSSTNALVSCRNIPRDSTFIQGEGQARVMFMRNLCEGERSGQRFVFEIAKRCERPEMSRGFSCLNRQFSLSNGLASQAFFGDETSYFTLAQTASFVSQQRDECEYPTTLGVKSATQVGVFVEY